MFEIKHLTEDSLDRLLRFWIDSFPLHPMNKEILRQRVFGPPDAAPENSLCYYDDGGRLIALSLLVAPGATPAFKPPSARLHDTSTQANADYSNERIGGIRWFGVHPDYRGKNVASQLIQASIARLIELDATAADFLSTPPYYIQPGVDTRLTGLISFLMRHGFEHYRTNFNMTVDLEAWNPPPSSKIYDADELGYSIRRAGEDDREAFDEYARRVWTEGWAVEGALGLEHDPASLFLGVKNSQSGEEIVGFAVYEANQGLGCFGPAGVSIDHQGRGLGKRLLWATLDDMKKLGRKRSEIGWIGPLDFYYQNAGAELGPIFWGMRKMLKESR